MIISDTHKNRTIQLIDNLLDKFNEDSSFRRELRLLKLKYIYKDIGRGEFLIDLKYLKDVKDYTDSYFFKKQIKLTK